MQWAPVSPGLKPLRWWVRRDFTLYFPARQSPCLHRPTFFTLLLHNSLLGIACEPLFSLLACLGSPEFGLEKVAHSDCPVYLGPDRLQVVFFGRPRPQAGPWHFPTPHDCLVEVRQCLGQAHMTIRNVWAKEGVNGLPQTPPEGAPIPHAL